MDQDSFDIEYEGSLILKNLEIRGNIKSDKDICLKGIIEGDVHCKACVIINNNALIDGDVYCDRLFIDGKITGNVHVIHRAVLGRHAVIGGHLITESLTIHPEATIGKGLKLKENKVLSK